MTNVENPMTKEIRSSKTQMYDVGKFVDGKKAGEWKIYDKTGQVTRVKKFQTAGH